MYKWNLIDHDEDQLLMAWRKNTECLVHCVRQHYAACWAWNKCEINGRSARRSDKVSKVEHTQPMQPRSAVASKPQDENASFQAQPWLLRLVDWCFILLISVGIQLMIDDCDGNSWTHNHIRLLKTGHFGEVSAVIRGCSSYGFGSGS